MSKTLYRSTTNRVIAGVCAGLADYFDIDPVLVRVIFVAAAVLTQGFGILVYLLLWAFVPEKLDDAISKSVPMEKNHIKAAKEKESIPRIDRQEMAERSSATGGLVLVAIGLIFLVRNFWPTVDWGKLWPLLLLAVGVGILWNSNRKREP